MASTYTPLATYTVSGSSVSSIDFSDISQNYTDLVIVCYLRGTATATTVTLLQTTNNRLGNSYDGIDIKGNGTSATSSRYNYYDGSLYYYAPMGVIPAASSTANTFSSQIIEIASYSNTTTHKNSLCRAGVAEYQIQAISNIFFYNEAVTRLTYRLSSGNFDIGSYISIYGIKAA